MTTTAARSLSAGSSRESGAPIDWDTLFPPPNRVAQLVSDAPADTPSGPEPTEGVLDHAILAQLEQLIGSKRVCAMLAAFEVDLGQRLCALETLTAAALSGQAHALRSSSGQLGFLQLSRISADIEDEARRGGGLDRVADLRAAAERARAAARARCSAQIA